MSCLLLCFLRSRFVIFVFGYTLDVSITVSLERIFHWGHCMYGMGVLFFQFCSAEHAFSVFLFVCGGQSCKLGSGQAHHCRPVA
ncbi:hypothetical protein JB92DRAFT_3007574 [Gautieria morchelliformis]|nr:hypothetical protein JB92DRAFT_3007574 [Gautieria morchelliformis]